ncbi:hypothetical protein HPB47_020557 [Ixodes persulcatus]|uniref:Uncharacterized protein n=1 Tax=Ixodes persulcatus TaxID=34615 RepID=A0AC60QF15_IXOPE|nr:hypothetical protein HPB47_020557 [Ixodes persulcatus]
MASQQPSSSPPAQALPSHHSVESRDDLDLLDHVGAGTVVAMDVSATNPEHALPALEFPSTSTHTVPGTGLATTASAASPPSVASTDWSTHLVAAADDAGNPWLSTSRNRRRQAPSGTTTSAFVASYQRVRQTPSAVPRGERRTVILRPSHGISVASLPHSPIQKCVVEAAGSLSHQCRIRIQTRANLIAVDTWEPEIIPKLLEITQINFGTNKMVHFRPYEPMREGWCRGVFHGADPSDSPEDLLAELSCPTHKILAARHMDGEGRTVMITVDGSTLPKEVLYRLHLKKVFPFQVRAILCTRCHQLGHQHDVCPAAQAVCACGRPPHRHEIDGCHEPHQCVLCGGSHLATDGTCPKVKQATAQRRTRWAPPPQRKARQQRRTLQAKPPPPPFAKDHGDLETIWPPLRPVTPTKPPHETTTLPRAQACVQVMPRRIPPPRPPPPSSESIARARADTTRSQQRPHRTHGVQTTLAVDDQPATRIELNSTTSPLLLQPPFSPPTMTSCPTTGGSADGADYALTGRPSDPFGPGLTVLQWNCRSYRQHGPELKRRLAASAHPPDIILLQEARVSEPNIVGYRAFSTPTIIVAQKGPRRKRDAQGNISQREVTAVSARLRDKDIVVVSVYWRPPSTTNDEDAEWLKLLCTHTIHPLPVLIGGDFNAHHTSWGSKSNTVRGRSVADNALVAGLVLANSPDAVTHQDDPFSGCWACDPLREFHHQPYTLHLGVCHA